MQSTSNDNGDLDEILIAYVAEHRKPSFEAACDYLGRFPQFARELIEFTVEWAVLAQAPAVSSRDGERDMEQMADDALAQLHGLFVPVDQRRARFD
jgi:hypothetical protein